MLIDYFTAMGHHVYHPNALPGLIVTCLVVASVLQLLCLAIVYICVSVTLA